MSTPPFELPEATPLRRGDAQAALPAALLSPPLCREFVGRRSGIRLCAALDRSIPGRRRPRPRVSALVMLRVGTAATAMLCGLCWHRKLAVRPAQPRVRRRTRCAVAAAPPPLVDAFGSKARVRSGKMRMQVCASTLVARAGPVLPNQHGVAPAVRACIDLSCATARALEDVCTYSYREQQGHQSQEQEHRRPVIFSCANVLWAQRASSHQRAQGMGP